jgi:hypothetical protein
MDPFRTAVEAEDIVAATDLLSDDVEFHSPFAFKPFVGKESVTALLTAVMETFTDFAYSDEFADGATTGLIFDAKVGDKKVQGLDLIRHDADGKINHFTVMLRPASGLMAMGEAMGPKVAGLAKGDAPK